MRPEDMVQDENELNQNENIVGIAPSVELQLSDYQTMYDCLYEVAESVEKSMVTVTGMSSDVDWFNNKLESENETTGFIIADNSKELLILAERRFIVNASEIKITFVDGVQVPATIKKYDKTTDLAILAVDMSLLTLSTKESIEYAKLGSSISGNKTGDLVIAVGSPLGYEDSLCYGNITSMGNDINEVDINYKLITTDIYGSSNASGALINAKGQIIGIINQSYNSKDLSNQISAIGISELRKVIERMSNANDSVYMGLYVTNVTEWAQTQLKVPQGAYVTDIVLDSPAMLVGIQKGDVVTAIDDVAITSVADYVSELHNHSAEEKVDVIIQRMSVDGYREIELEVTLGIYE